MAHQTRNVPHSGHEWMMKGAYLAAEAQGILVSAVIGEKKPGDYIDEAIVLGHDKLRESGFIRPDVHQTSTLMWDMEVRRSQGSGVPRVGAEEHGLHPPHVRARPRRSWKLLRHLRRP